MSKGKILAHLGAGQYSVEVYRQDELAATEWTRKTADLNYINSTLLPQKETELTELETAESEAEAEVENAISSLNTCIAITGDRFQCQPEQNAAQSATTARVKSSIAVATKKAEIADAKAAALQLQKDITRLNTRPAATETVSAWCADACDVTDNTGANKGHGLEIPVNTIVSIADVPSNSGTDTDNRRYFVVWPYDDLGGDYDEARDGIENSTFSASPEQAASFNALYSPVETWTPLYRAATITAMVDDTHADITIEAATDLGIGNIQNPIDLNEQIGTSLSNVEIDYMGSAGPPMTTGDKILVWFAGRDITAPKIIGFIDNPKPVDVHTAIYTASGGLSLSGETTQYIRNAENGTAVTVIGDFGSWSDNPTIGNPRTDTDVREDLSVTAYTKVAWPTTVIMRPESFGSRYSQETYNTFTYGGEIGSPTLPGMTTAAENYGDPWRWGSTGDMPISYAMGQGIYSVSLGFSLWSALSSGGGTYLANMHRFNFNFSNNFPHSELFTVVKVGTGQFGGFAVGYSPWDASKVNEIYRGTYDSHVDMSGHYYCNYLWDTTGETGYSNTICYLDGRQAHEDSYGGGFRPRVTGKHQRGATLYHSSWFEYFGLDGATITISQGSESRTYVWDDTWIDTGYKAWGEGYVNRWGRKFILQA